MEINVKLTVPDNGCIDSEGYACQWYIASLLTGEAKGICDPSLFQKDGHRSKGDEAYSIIGHKPHHKCLKARGEKYVNEKALPTLSDLRGIAPEMTGDMTTEEFIRSIREDDD